MHPPYGKDAAFGGTHTPVSAKAQMSKTKISVNLRLEQKTIKGPLKARHTHLQPGIDDERLYSQGVDIQLQS